MVRENVFYNSVILIKITDSRMWAKGLNGWDVSVSTKEPGSRFNIVDFSRTRLFDNVAACGPVRKFLKSILGVDREV